MKRLVLLIAVMTIMSIPAHSQWSADPLQNAPVGVSNGDQIITKISTHPSGITYVAYFSLEGGNYNVRLQKIDVFGNIQWGAAGLLVSDHNADSWITDFDMKVDKDTCAIVVFQDIRSGSNEVYAYRISPAGFFLWGADGIRLTTNADADYSPVVAPTDAGNSVFAWQNSGAKQMLGMQKIDPQGLKLWGEGILLEGAVGENYKFPRILPAPGDQAYLMWFKQGPGMYDPKYLNAQKISPAGASAWASDLAVAGAGGHPMVPDIAYINDTAGGLFVCWYDDRNNDWNYSTFVQHIDTGGNALWTTDGIEAIVNNANNHMYPEIAVTGDGKDLYVFVEEMDANQSDQGIYGQRLNVTGTQMWETTGKVFKLLSNSEVGMLQAQTTGKNCALFYLEGPSFGNSVLKAMLVDQDGNYIWPTMSGHTVVSSAGSAKTDLATSFSNEQWVATWSDARTDGGDIYGQNLKPDGTFGPLPGILSLSTDSVIFITYDDCFNGKPLVIRNPTPVEAVISSIDDYFVWPGAMWYIEEPPVVPAIILPGDSITLLIKVTFPVRANTDFLTDTLNINTNLGPYFSEILMNSQLAIDINEASPAFVRAFPNPFTSSVIIQGSLPGEKSAIIEIRDLSGRLLKQDHLQIPVSGNYLYKFSADGVQAGSYICRISGQKSLSESILLIKK